MGRNPQVYIYDRASSTQLVHISDARSPVAFHTMGTLRSTGEATSGFLGGISHRTDSTSSQTLGSFSDDVDHNLWLRQLNHMSSIALSNFGFCGISPHLLKLQWRCPIICAKQRHCWNLFE